MKWFIETLIVYVLGFGLLVGAIAIDIALAPEVDQIPGVRILTGDALEAELAKWVKGAPKGKYSIATCPKG